MAQDELTYNDKSNPVPIVNRDQQATADDFNDIKSVVNNNAQDVEDRLGEFLFTFEDSDLVAGVLPTSFTTHNLDTEFPKLTLKRPNGKFEETTQIMSYIDANTIQLDFGGPISSGTWEGLITKR